MPNRILRDWTDSESVDMLSVHAERFFTRLIMKADDFGRYTANVKLLKSTLFPLKTDVRETDITLWLTECKQCGLIALYNIAFKDYLQILNFNQRLRQTIEKYPPPPDKQDKAVCQTDDSQLTVKRPLETKRNESEEETKEKARAPEYLLVERIFLQQGGTKEMALAFFNRYEAVEWKIRGTPIKNFSPLIGNFITNWKENQNGKSIAGTGNKSHPNNGSAAGAILLLNKVKQQFNT